MSYLSGADLFRAELNNITWDKDTTWYNVQGLDEALDVPEGLLSQLNPTAHPRPQKTLHRQPDTAAPNIIPAVTPTEPPAPQVPTNYPNLRHAEIPGNSHKGCDRIGRLFMRSLLVRYFV